MECEHLRGTMLDAAAEQIARSPGFERHLRTCLRCSEQFDDLCTTMQAAAASFAGLLFVGAVVVKHSLLRKDSARSKSELMAPQGTAVGDLQALEDKGDLYDSEST
jgi:hypothetical protein